MQTISFISSPIHSKDPQLDISNVYRSSIDIDLLRSIAVYGANGSGKSNLIKALSAMLTIQRDSLAKDNVLSELIRPFLLHEETKKEPSFFQLQFIVDGVRYRYGFEADQTKIRSEWLFGPAEKKETFYFTREGQDIQVNKKYFKEGIRLESKTKETNLLDKDLLRRDQIYFAEKDTKGKSYFYSLYDIKGVRNDASFEKDYIKGKYGAIPFLGDFNTLFDVEKAT